LSRVRGVVAALWGHPEEAPPSSNWLATQLSISRIVALVLLLRAGRAVALWLGAYDYEASAVGLAVGMYGLVGIKYVLAGLDKYATVIASKRGKIVLACLWFLTLSGPVLFAGLWLSLQPIPNTTWYGRLMYVAMAIALVIAGFREAISIRPHAARDTPSSS
jgi:hypothetical protein